jgi:hypothetical protein
MTFDFADIGAILLANCKNSVNFDLSNATQPAFIYSLDLDSGAWPHI